MPISHDFAVINILYFSLSRVRTLSVDLTSGPEDVRRDLGRAVEEDEEGFGPVYMLVFF